MSFDQRGSFNKSQLDRFAAFARAQVGDIGGRINHLVTEQQRVGLLTFAYDAGGIPTAYSVDPPTSYLAKLLAIYEILGGDPFFDLKVRTRNQPIFLFKADETGPAQLLSTGEILPQPGLGDVQSRELMTPARVWLKDVLEYRRERLEHQIRRLIDYQEQLQLEQEALARVASDADVEDSLEYLLAGLEALMNDPTYPAVSDDKGADPQGQLTSAPLAAYDPGPDRAPGDTYTRHGGGTAKPGGST